MKWNTVCSVIGSVVFIATTYGCDDDTGARCGPGTELIAGECLPAQDGGLADAAEPDAAASSCGEHTFNVDGVCKGVQPVGGACQRGGECEAGSCLPESDGFTGGYCSDPNCNDLRPCATGAHCVYSSKRGTSVCLAFCSGASECREGYVCQPIFTAPGVSVCSPSCTQSNACPDQTYCDDASGKCLLRECDPSQSNDCGDGRTCYPDPRHLTTSGGLCLSLCDPSEPKCQGVDVCQPLPEDPTHKGICAPPVCKQTSDCRAGTVCSNSVCQPPARCDDQGACSDAATACVGGAGGQCMPKCEDEATCDAIHSELTCAQNVAKEPVCLPVGSFPGSACRSDLNNACDGVAAGNTTAKMTCEDDRCLVSCGNGGDSLCKAISPSLNCASGIYAQPVCLPSGSYPGGPCGGAKQDSCSDVKLADGSSAKLQCKAKQCVFDCGSAAIGDKDAEVYCAGIDASLTCAKTTFPGSAVCLPQGSFPGGPCSHGTCGKYGAQSMACENNLCLLTCAADNPATTDNEDSCKSVDASLVCAHGIYAQDVCLPQGSFPGSACGGANHDQCAQNLNGVDELDMQCVNGACVIGCSEADKWAGYGESLCSFADPTLTCAQAGGSVCVKACSNGTCASGFSCLDAGAVPTHENACLPNGSFPGSTCATNDSCGAGPGGTTMSCRSGKCAVNCPAGSAGDSVCGAINPGLTCSDASGGICLTACNAAFGATKCPSGQSCLASDNACLPNGSFLGAACATGNVCQGNPMLVCVPSATPVCAAGCSVANGQAAGNQYCTAVGTQTGAGFNTCSDVGGGLRICTKV